MKSVRLPFLCFRLLLLICLPLLVGSCAFFSKSTTDSVSLETLSLKASSDVNLNTAISVDLVVAYSTPLYGTFKKMTAEAYYTSVEQLRRDHYGLIQIWHWEVVPGQVKAYQLMAPLCGAVGAVLFADYNTPGEHRADVGKMPHAVVYLEKKGFHLSTQAPQEIPLEEACPVSLETPLIQHPKSLPSSPSTDGK
jgi:type VI secretion system protein